ncbi:MAG TPA: sulfatase-like hydrolase/transferase [bacterium]|nr:sulfatase-like hydrolase/transferase [bacterium]
MKNRLLALVKRTPLSFVIVFALFFFDYASFLTRAGVIHPTFALFDIVVILGSLCGALLLWFIIGTLLSIGPRSYLVLFSIYIFFYHLFGTYRFRSKIPFDVSVMMDNSGEAWNSESLIVILDSLSLHVLLIGIAPLLAVLFIPPLRRLVMRERQYGARRYIAAAAAIPLYGWLMLSPFALHDDLGAVLRSVHDYVRRDSLYQTDKNTDPDTYPFITNENMALSPGNTGKRSHIFIVEIESFSKAVVETTTPDGRPYTPYLNEKIKEGLYFERFYANSIQSAKGQFATLFSIIPSFKQKVFTSFRHVQFQSLPQVLRDNGYSTFFFKAYRDINFDNTGRFVTKNGVETALSIVPFLTPEDKQRMWGWGIEDEIFFKRFFEYLDTREEVVSGQKPVFALLHTVMNHMRFNEVPVEKRRLYPDAKNLPEHYANSIRLTDEQLHFFFDELAKRPYLKDAIVIVTGDHSYPLNEHGYQHNETAWYEEFFRTPFLLIAPGRFKPGRITDKAYQQIDIAPTLLELVGIKPKRHHFRGVSMFAAKPQQPIYLVQPYNGIYLGVIEGGRYKYVTHLRSKREFLYDLKVDPKEEKNLAGEAGPAFKNHLNGLLQTIYLNQKLIESDRVWKPLDSGKK